MHEGYFCKEKLLLSCKNIFIWHRRSASTDFPYFRATPIQKYCTCSQSLYLTLMALLWYPLIIIWVNVSKFSSCQNMMVIKWSHRDFSKPCCGKDFWKSRSSHRRCSVKKEHLWTTASENLCVRLKFSIC